MDEYLWIKYVHILGATIIFGTGIGTAFQMWSAHRSRDIRALALVTRNVVKADWVFTTPAVLLQPVTGTILAVSAGYSLRDQWLLGSILLYGLAGLCWLPVVWIQIKLRDLTAWAAETSQPLPPAYDRLFRWWFVLGLPGFGSVLVIFHLMIQKPAF